MQNLPEPKHVIVKKEDSKLMKFISNLLFWQKKVFMESYVTTVGRTIYWPSTIGEDEGLLQHELQHVRDYNKYGILFSLSYLLLPPALITMRGFWERRAYTISIKYWVAADPQNTDWITPFLLDQFTSSRYLWMDVRKKFMTNWINSEIQKAKQAIAG